MNTNVPNTRNHKTSKLTGS